MRSRLDDRMRTIDAAEWEAAIEKRYGLSLRPGQVYSDRRGFVYAGSEYVARLGIDASPEHAIEWTSSIGAFERRGGEVALVEHGEL